MNLNVALTITKNVGWNGLVGAGHYFAGFAVAAVVNTIASKILNPIQNTNLDGNIKFFAAGIGMAVTFYYAPQIALVSFTANLALKLVALNVALTALSGYSLPLRLITTGAMAGCFGPHALAAFTGAGAMAGSYVKFF